MRTGQWPERVSVRSASGKFDSRGGRFDATRPPSPALRATTTPTAGDLESETDRESITPPDPIIGPGCPLVHSSAPALPSRELTAPDRAIRTPSRRVLTASADRRI